MRIIDGLERLLPRLGFQLLKVQGLSDRLRPRVPIVSYVVIVETKE